MAAGSYCLQEHRSERGADCSCAWRPQPLCVPVSPGRTSESDHISIVSQAPTISQPACKKPGGRVVTDWATCHTVRNCHAQAQHSSHSGNSVTPPAPCGPHADRGGGLLRLMSLDRGCHDHQWQ